MKKGGKRTNYWSKKVTEKSHTLELEEGVFTWENPKKIAKSLQKSALISESRKTIPYQSAMSMLNFYINRAGGNLDSHQKKFRRVKREIEKAI